MPYTRADLSTIEAAIMELASGATVVSINIAGKTTEFHQNRLESLLKLRSMMQRELGDVPTNVYIRNGGRSRT